MLSQYLTPELPPASRLRTASISYAKFCHPSALANEAVAYTIIDGSP